MPDLSQDLPETDARLSRKIRQRRCIATRATMAMEDLLRFALAPDGTVTADLSGKLPGRGAHLTPTRAALAEAIKTRAFGRAFKQAVTVPEDFTDQLAKVMQTSLLNRLALARRAGDLAVGQDAVAAAIRSGKAALVIVPKDMPNAPLTRGPVPRLAFATAEALGQALGKPRVRKLAFTHRVKGEQFLALADKFRDFLDPSPQDPKPKE